MSPAPGYGSDDELIPMDEEDEAYGELDTSEDDDEDDNEDQQEQSEQEEDAAPVSPAAANAEREIDADFELSSYNV